MSTRPKSDATLVAGVSRLLSSQDYRRVVAHHEALLAWTKNALIHAAPADVPMLQGRAQQLTETLELLTKDK